MFRNTALELVTFPFKQEGGGGRVTTLREFKTIKSIIFKSKTRSGKKALFMTKLKRQRDTEINHIGPEARY